VYLDNGDCETQNVNANQKAYEIENSYVGKVQTGIWDLKQVLVLAGLNRIVTIETQHF